MRRATLADIAFAAFVLALWFVLCFAFTVMAGGPRT